MHVKITCEDYYMLCIACCNHRPKRLAFFSAVFPVMTVIPLFTDASVASWCIYAISMNTARSCTITTFVYVLK